MITKTVKPACPAVNDNTGRGGADGQDGQRQQEPERAGVAADAKHDRRPDREACHRPATARSAVAPVPRALDRSTDRVPSATQNACETSVILATATASARAAAPRSELRSHTERTVRWIDARCLSARAAGGESRWPDTDGGLLRRGEAVPLPARARLSPRWPGRACAVRKVGSTNASADADACS